MRVTDLLRLLDEQFEPAHTKLHLATWNGVENPLDVYLAGKFEEWQRWQTKKNFGRRTVLSLIALPAQKQWLFAGMFDVLNSNWISDREMYYYDLSRRVRCDELDGRLVIGFERPGRQSYLQLEKWSELLTVVEIYPTRRSVGEFPGFKAVNLSHTELTCIVRQGTESWKAALSSVAGVYLITDSTTGKLYIGSATGEGGLWQRWCGYAMNGHGGNVGLKARLLDDPAEAAVSALRYSVLEIADTHASSDEVLRRETHWKTILMTRDHGLNGN